jgi:hypothetical protein
MKSRIMEVKLRTTKDFFIVRYVNLEQGFEEDLIRSQEFNVRP